MARKVNRRPAPVTRIALMTAVFGMAMANLQAAEKNYWNTGVTWPELLVVEPSPATQPSGPPSDAVVLFDGKDFSAWKGGEKWTIKDGYAICGGSDLVSKQPFGDCQLHIEWSIPADVKGSGQGRGNSGVFLMSEYEIQVLESYHNENKTYIDGIAGSIYKQRPPLVSACRKPGEWQSYDIIFKAPRFDANGKIEKPAYMTVLQNGVLIQDHFELLGHTNYRQAPRYRPHEAKMPLRIQNHHAPIHFRNIWIRELQDEHENLLMPYREKLKSEAH